jgi:VanZ family protein
LKYWLTTLVSLGILLLVLLPGSTIPNPKIVGLDKVVHFTMFFAWITAVRYDFPSAKKWVLLLVGLGFGVLTEFFQLFVKDRSFDVLDLVTDGVGVIIGLILSAYLVPFIKNYL